MGQGRRLGGGRAGARPARTKARAAVAAPDGAKSIREVPIADVLEWAEGRWTPRLETSDPGAHSTARTTLTLIDTLQAIWTGRNVGELTQLNNHKGTVDLYVKRRSAEDNATNRRTSDGTLKKVSAETAWSEVTRLMAEVREYAAHHGMSDVPDIDIPTREPRQVVWLQRREVARLLWAVRGRVWDADRDDWKVDKRGRRVLTRKRDIGWIARLILILVYTGSTANCAARLAWEPSADGSRSHVDLDTEVGGRTGHLHRLGPDLASKRMAGVPVTLCRRLAAHLRRWRLRDGGRHERVLHLTGKHGSRHRSAGTIIIGRQTLDRVYKRAGLAGQVNLPTLGDTAAVWALRAGSRDLNATSVPDDEPSRAIARSVAFMIGVNTRSFDKRFRHLKLKYQGNAMEALTNLAATVI